MTVTAAVRQSLPVHLFVGSLNDMNNIHESGPAVIGYHIPSEVIDMLLAVAMVGMHSPDGVREYAAQAA